MIQVDNENIDRGKALYKMMPGAVESCVKARKADSFNSRGYKGLRNRCTMNDQMIDGIFKNTQSFISDVAPQIIRKAYHEYNAVYSKFLEADPMFDIPTANGIKEAQAKAMQTVLMDGCDQTQFKDKCVFWDIDMAVRYGTYANYSFVTDDSRANSLMTIMSPEGTGDYRQQLGNNKLQVCSIPIHPLNVINDPRSNFMVESSFTGFIGDIPISTLKTLMDNPEYIGENIKDLLNQAKQGISDKNYFAGQSDQERRDFSRGHANITYLWTTLPFEDNEDDPTWYAIEMVHDKIIRIEVNPLDFNTVPIALGTMIPRPYTWAGNTNLEDKIALQNWAIWLYGTSIESTMKLMDRIVLYQEGSLPTEALNNRHRTGGLVPIKKQDQPLEKIMHSPQFQNTSFQELNWHMQEIRREDQDSSPTPSFAPQAQGGPDNKTLGGAQMMAGIGEMLTERGVGRFSMGLAATAQHRLVLHRAIATSEGVTLSDGKVVSKELLLGDPRINVKTSNFLNYIKEATDATNAISQIVNWRGTKIPEFFTAKLQSFYDKWMRAVLKKEKLDDFQDAEALKWAEAQRIQGFQPPQPPPATPPDRPTISAAYKDLPAEAQAQFLAQCGIQVSAQVIAKHQVLTGQAPGQAPTIPAETPGGIAPVSAPQPGAGTPTLPGAPQ
jgi:hypothetical protein